MILLLEWCSKYGLDIGKALRLEFEQDLKEEAKLITEWKDLEGKTIKRVVEDRFDGCVLFFEDGTRAYISASGEEIHGAHWPILSDDEDFIEDLKEDPIGGILQIRGYRADEFERESPDFIQLCKDSSQIPF